MKTKHINAVALGLYLAIVVAGAVIIGWGAAVKDEGLTVLGVVILFLGVHFTKIVLSERRNEK